MPKLPKGVFVRGKRRRAYWFRDRRGGGDVWVRLGASYGEMVRAYREYQRKGREEPRQRVTVMDAASRWLATRVRTGRNEKGQKTAAARVQKYLEPFLGQMLVTKVTGNHLREYRLWLEGRCRTAATVRHILGDARNLFYWCEESGLVERAPVPKRWMPRLQERPPDRLFDEEVEVLASLPDPHGFVIRLGLGTGLRWGELCRAQVRHLEGDTLVVGQTKSGKVRRIPLDGALYREVRSRIGRLVPFAEKSPGSFANTVRRRTGVERFHVHQLRHTFGCRWIERGGSLAALQELMGHSSILVTQRYARLSDDMVKREVHRIATG